MSSTSQADRRSSSRFTPARSSRSTSAKSKTPSSRSRAARGKNGAVYDSGPFALDVWRQAVEIATQYQIVIVRDPDVGFFGRTVEMPFAMSDGKTIEECATNTLEATASGIAVMLEAGQTPPSPAREGKRDQQVNIRLTAEEKLRLEGLAAREGFRSISDYVRSAALRRAD